MSDTNEQKLQQETSSESAEVTAKLDMLDQLLKPEVQESLTVLVEQLPKLAEMTEMLTKTYDFAQKVAADKVLIQDMVGGIQDIVEPVGEKLKMHASAMIEANDRADQSDEMIGLFGMVKLLKDPELQRMLRFGQAYLEILGEKKQQG